MPLGDGRDGALGQRAGEDHDAVNEGKIGADRGKREVEDLRVDREIDQLPCRGGEIVRGAGGDIVERERHAYPRLTP